MGLHRLHQALGYRGRERDAVMTYAKGSKECCRGHDLTKHRNVNRRPGGKLECILCNQIRNLERRKTAYAKKVDTWRKG